MLYIRCSHPRWSTFAPFQKLCRVPVIAYLLQEVTRATDAIRKTLSNEGYETCALLVSGRLYPLRQPSHVQGARLQDLLIGMLLDGIYRPFRTLSERMYERSGDMNDHRYPTTWTEQP